jgi:hypothetical protein
MPEPKSPVIKGLEQFEVNIGGPQNGQPEFMALPAFRSPEGKVMSRWQLTLWERLQIALGADVFVTIWCGPYDAYPATEMRVMKKDASAEVVRADFQLDHMLVVRLAADRVQATGRACFRCIQLESVALGARVNLYPKHMEGCESHE